MKKNLEHHHHSIGVFILVLVVVLLIMVVISYFNPNTLSSNKDLFTKIFNTHRGRTYESDSLHMTIWVPPEFSVEENLGSINLTNQKGNKIVISGIGTNFDRLDSYLNDIIEKNNSTLEDKQNLLISNYPSIKATINDRRYYLIYKDNWVYTFQAVSPSLYDELDQVAQSFRYTGD